MGNTESSNTLTRITNQTVEISAQSITNCMVQASQKQIARIQGMSIGRGNKRSINQSMQMVMDVNCEQKATVDLDIQQAVATAIAQEAKAQGTDLSLLTQSKATNTTTITENIKADINMDNIVNTGVGLEQRQQAEFLGGIVGVDNEDSIRQGMTAEVFLSGLADTIKKSKFVQDAAAEIDQKGTAKTDSTITGVIGSFTSAYAAIAIAIIIGLVLFAWSFFSSASGLVSMGSSQTFASPYIEDTQYDSSAPPAYAYQYDKLAPSAPMAPMAPSAPMAPMAPSAPMAPMAPSAPMAPMAPSAPVTLPASAAPPAAAPPGI
jgi:hypothetical protein